MSLSDLGQYLRHVRQERGISLRELEHDTRIRMKYLTAIEEGDIAILQSDVQLYGFVRRYALQVGLDPDSTISMLHQSLKGRRKKGLLTFFRTSKEVTAPQRDWPDVALTHSPSFHKNYSSEKSIFSLPRFFNLQILIVVLLVISLAVFFSWGSPYLKNTITKLNIQAVSTPIILGPTITSTFLSYVPVTSTNLPALVNFSDINLTVMIEQRAFLRVSVDGVLEYQGILPMGERRDYFGNEQIELTTGNGKGVRVIYNQSDEGIMGDFGEVVTWTFLPNLKFTSVLNVTNEPSGTSP
jgi:cytoskeleton protein RodZ